jgi:hypothetical protein
MADRGNYQELAAQCVREAEASSAPETRAFLLMIAQAWMKLAERRDQIQPRTVEIGERAKLHIEGPKL